MNKSGTVIASKLLVNGSEVADNVSCQLPSIEVQTSELKGAGIMGSIDMPSTGQLSGLTFAVNLRSVNKNSGDLMKPGVINIELRFVKDVMTTSGMAIKEGTKIFLTGYNKKLDPGKVEQPTTMDGSAEYEITRYRIVVDGVEILLVDKLNYIYKVNGIDYMESVRAALG